MTSYILLLT